jgi:SAM-dependent methyltransferase
VLNLGCFFPEDEEAFGHLARTWLAIDFVKEVVARCVKYRPWPHNVGFMQHDMRDLHGTCVGDAQFDVVTDFSSGDHLLKEDWLLVVAEVFRVLRPAGHFLVCFANNEAFIAFFGESWRERPAQSGEYGYVRTDTIAEMQAMLEAAGFEIVRKSHDNAGQLRTGMLARKP